MAFGVEKGLRELKTMQLYADVRMACFTTFCLSSKPSLGNGGATITPLAAQPLTGDLQRRWGPGLRFTLTFDMQTRGSLFL